MKRRGKRKPKPVESGLDIERLGFSSAAWLLNSLKAVQHDLRLDERRCRTGAEAYKGDSPYKTATAYLARLYAALAQLATNAVIEVEPLVERRRNDPKGAGDGPIEDDSDQATTPMPTHAGRRSCSSGHR